MKSLLYLCLFLLSPFALLGDEPAEPEKEVLIYLDGKYDLSQFPTEITSYYERTQLVAKTLSQFTESKLAALLESTEVKKEELSKVQLLWILNAAKITAPESIIEKLQTSNARIIEESPKEISELEKANASLLVNRKRADEEPELSWAVSKMNVPKMWEKGHEGENIVVAMIDTGINTTHPDIADNMLVNPGESGLDKDGNDKATNQIDDDNNGYVDDVLGWNFEKDNNDITDDHGHGSKTAGIVGGMGTNGQQTGMAPKVKMIGIKSCCSLGSSVFESKTWEALQYTITRGARMISMSLSIKYYSNPTYEKWRQAGEVLLAAQIVHVNSAGNLGSGSEPKNIGAPASNPGAWLHPLQLIKGGLTSMITIGATDEEDEVRYYSSTGPSTWEDTIFGDYAYNEGDEMGLVKPDVCGPSEMPSIAGTGTGYVSSFGGTSSATPAVAGATATLLSARSDLTVAQVTESLAMSAKEIESPFNNKCGAGRVDILNALTYANEKFPVEVESE